MKETTTAECLLWTGHLTNISIPLLFHAITSSPFQGGRWGSWPLEIYSCKKLVRGASGGSGEGWGLSPQCSQSRSLHLSVMTSWIFLEIYFIILCDSEQQKRVSQHYLLGNMFGKYLLSNRKILFVFFKTFYLLSF